MKRNIKSIKTQPLPLYEVELADDREISMKYDLLDELQTSPDVMWIIDDELIPITIISEDEFKVTDPLQAIQIDRDEKINDLLK